MTTATGAKPTLPHWDMTPYFPALESPEFTQAFTEALHAVDGLVELFAELKDDPDPARALERLLEAQNSLSEQLGLVSAYISSFVSTNTKDLAAQAKLSELKQRTVRLQQLEAEITAWIGTLDVETAIAFSAVAAEHAFMLRKTKLRSRYLMSPAEEDLAAELNPSGPGAWAQLHDDLTSQILVDLEVDGKVSSLPMSAIRNLANNPDAAVRKRAYDAELAAWEAWRVPIAAALNGIKGSVNAISRRRGWESPLAASLFSNNADQASLNAMMAAAKASFPDFRRYLKAKARLFGAGSLRWHDMFAPVAKETRAWTWDEARDFLVQNFATFSPKLRDYAARAFRENWIDAEPRPGKGGGAFCMEVIRDESRILCNYNPSFDSVSTLAHELGHGYHNLCIAERPPLLRSSPMTLAETASIFCETIIRNAAVASATADERLIILEGSLQGSCQVVVDIASRFQFEQSIFEARKARELSAQEFSELMTAAQEATYGDGLDPNVRHPYMWAVKGHYYSTFSYYNYPYMFGLLFGLGLYARYEQDPDSFYDRYDNLLSSTGRADAATLAREFGIDIGSEEFWTASLDVIRRDIDRFEEIVAQRMKG